MGTSLVFALAACGGGDDAAEEPADNNTGTEEPADTGGETASAGNGEELYTAKNCASCHGQNLEGMGDAFPALTDVGSRLSQDEIKEVIQNGRGAMPAQNVTEEEATALSEWLASKQ